MSTEPPISVAMDYIAQLAIALGVAPINTFEGCWEYQVDEQWWIACNAHPEPKGCSRGPKVPPFHTYIEYNGWPAGLMTPYGGTIAAGEGANEDTLVAALAAAVEKAGN